MFYLAFHSINKVSTETKHLFKWEEHGPFPISHRYLPLFDRLPDNCTQFGNIIIINGPVTGTQVI